MQLLIGHGQVPTIMPEASYFFPENVSEDLLSFYKEENDRNMAFVKKSLQTLFGQITLRDDAEIKQDAIQLSVLLSQKIMIDSYRYREEKKE